MAEDGQTVVAMYFDNSNKSVEFAGKIYTYMYNQETIYEK